MKIMAITQARFSSSRLPGKVLKGLGQKTALDLHLKRIKRSKLINSFMVATTHEPESKEIEKIALAQGFQCFHGHLDDVLDRFYKAALVEMPDYVIRLTSDCPLIDADYIDDLIKKFQDSGADYASNCMNPTLPDGMDAEIFKFEALKKAWEEAKKDSEREHVTPYIRESGQFKVLSVQYPKDLSELRMTLDTEEDYQMLKALVSACGEDKGLNDYISYLYSHPEVCEMNSQHQRNEGYQKSLREDV